MLAPGPPLQPSGAEGRHLLRQELLHGEYHRQDLVQRILAWIWRRLQGGVGAASGSDWATTLVTMVVGAILLIGLVLVLSRLRRDRRRRVHAAVMAQDGLSSGELRRRAESALADGRHTDAVVEAFRAIAVRQVERGRLVDQPGTTAHEVAASLATSYPDHGTRVGRGADLFDATRYGHRPATREDATSLLDLDDVLAGAR